MALNLNTLLRRLKSLEIQGAKEIAVASLKFLRHYDLGFGTRFRKALVELEESRPTAVVLHNCLRILKKDPSTGTIDMLLKQIRISTEKIEHASTMIKSGQTVMTHCHSGVAVAALRHAWKSGKRIRVIATETEPKKQGIKTAKELARSGIPVTLIVDSAVSYFMPKVDLVLLGSDAMRREGNVNKIGSHNVALAAKECGKPYYIVASTMKLDSRPKISIEERPATEVYRKLRGVKIRNPAFDITPWKYVKAVVTEYGVKTPAQIVKMIK